MQLRACPLAATRGPVKVLSPSRGIFIARANAGGAGGMSEEQMQALKKALNDPQVQKQMSTVQAAMKDPGVQQQMQQYAAMMSNPTFMKRMAELREDPDLKEMFDDVAKNGMRAIMKYYNDPKFLKLMGEKVGDLVPSAAAAVPQKPPEVTNLLEACKFGDLEAAEDFIAIGKDINMTDSEGRTPLHFASAYDRRQVVCQLIEVDANLEAQDSKGNTPLHYAAGYGRGEVVLLLLDAGANAAAKNATGKTPLALVRLSKDNPINADEDILYKLEQGANASV